MDYNDIPVFVRVVETNSFTKAAESLGIQKSSVSRSIARLETELGVRLVQRTTRQLGLTDAGQTFYERVRGALVGVDEASATVRELGSEPRGTIRMTAPADATAIGLPDVIASFTRQYPAITVDVELSPRVVDLVSEGFDIALRTGKLADSSLIAKRVTATDLVLFASPAYVKARGQPRSHRELADHDCILLGARAGRANWTLHSDSEEEASVEVRGRINCDEIMFCLRAALAGGGIAALPPTLAREPYLRKELEVVLFGYRLRSAELHVVLPSAAFVPARVMLLRDHLVRELAAIAKSAHVQCSADHSAAAKTRSRSGRSAR